MLFRIFVHFSHIQFYIAFFFRISTLAQKKQNKKTGAVSRVGSSVFTCPASARPMRTVRSVLLYADDADLRAEGIIHFRDCRAHSAFRCPVRQKDDLNASLRIALPLLHH